MMIPVKVSFDISKNSNSCTLKRNGISVTCDHDELEEAKESFSSYYWARRRELLEQMLAQSEAEMYGDEAMVKLGGI